MKKNLAFGSWPSIITPAMVAGKSPKLSDVQIHNDRIFWSESIAAEKGRNAIMMYDDEGLQCILPRPLNARSKVHEYGGAAYAIDQSHIYFVLADDQAIYMGDFSAPRFEPKKLTFHEQQRYADLVYVPQQNRLIAVCEQHRSASHQDVDNRLVAIDLDGGNNISVLAQGYDFYSNPCISPDGRMIAWLSWNHPDMPWDNTELWLAEFSGNTLIKVKKIAGNGHESITQPKWSDSGDLYFVSDRNNWWNIYSIKHSQLQNSAPQGQAVFPMEAEFATPPWVFGMSSYGFLNSDTIFCTYTQEGMWHLGKIHLHPNRKNTFEKLPSDLTAVSHVNAARGHAVFIGASPYSQNTVYQYRNDEIQALSMHAEIAPAEEFSAPQPIRFATTGQQEARALFYPPANAQYECKDEKPPLIVLCHGGPTGACESSLNLKIQYWTNRGFAVADVNYRGSTGYGREFRHCLHGKWGSYDVDDVCAVVDYLAANDMIDRQRCVIKGGSAGGYTVLAALAFRDTFTAGVSLYGIGDLEMLVRDTHKFEARYLDRLVGPYPQDRHTYHERSPVHFIDDINCPLLIFQGKLDQVVPPNQAERMFAAVKAKGLPVACVIYEDEAHGFRNASNIEHMLACEHQFYARIFDFELAQQTPVDLVIENLES